MNEKKYNLNVSESYLNASSEERTKVVNSCGPDGFVNHLVPNRILGLNVVSACNAHDWDYSEARNKRDLEIADRRFESNLNKIINEETTDSLIRFLRKCIAKIYYKAVRLYSKLKDFD